ncbi:MAG: hypothetical protein JWQ19_1911 [Subtercola sp.]|nr:hypothetical protein [Subtercola sp.]
MGSWVTLTALQQPFAVVLEGVGETDARHFLESWQWCEAREVAVAPEGATIIRASVQDASVRRAVAIGAAATAAAAAEAAAATAAADPDTAKGAAASAATAVAAAADTAAADSDVGELTGAAETAEQRATAPTYRALADQLSGLITRLAIDARRAELLMFHAGGVADPATGDVIAFVGPSGRGKTTASIALGKVFEYVTDETLAVQDDLGVLAYGKPLSVKQPPPEYYKDQVSPSELGLNAPSGALRLVGVVMLDRQPGHEGAPSIRPVSVAESVEELVPQISYLPERQKPLRRLVQVLAACGGLRAVTYSEAATLPEVFARLFAEARAAGHGSGALVRGAGVGAGDVDARGALGAREVDARGAARANVVDDRGAAGAPGAAAGAAAAAEPAAAAPAAAAPPATAENTDTSDEELLRAEYADAVRDGESMIVLSGTTVRVLGGIAPTIIEAVELAPRSRRQLVNAVVEVHGDPGEGLAEGLVGAAVGELVEIGLLAVVGRGVGRDE